jgi:hypothetical protein
MIDLDMKKSGNKHIKKKNGNNCTKNKNQLHASQLLTLMVVGLFSLFCLHNTLHLQASNNDLQGRYYPIFQNFSPIVHLRGFLHQRELIYPF